MNHPWPRSLATLLALSGCATSSSTDADRKAVLATVQAFFDAMESRDLASAERTVIPEGVFVNTRVEDGRRIQRHFGNREWLDELSAKQTRMHEEFVGMPTVLVEGDVAVVWTSYAFSVDGKPSHTGVDAFQLIRTDPGWRISGGAYSVIRAAPSAGDLGARPLPATAAGPVH